MTHALSAVRTNVCANAEWFGGDLMNALGLARLNREEAQTARVVEWHARRPSLTEAAFAAQLCRERKRAERSGRKFALMLVESGPAFAGRGPSPDLLSALASQMRETDIVGWQKQDTVAGAILTEFGDQEMADALDSTRTRVSAGLHKALPDPQRNALCITFHVFPDQWDVGTREYAVDFALHPDIAADEKKGVRRAMKRALDIAGGLAALILLSPLFAVIALAVRLTSKGPAFFRQERIGQFGKAFTMYKFRSMKFQAASDRHEKFVQEFISGKMTSPGAAGIYKLTDDPRVTPLGNFLRRTSLDEIPQFFNILRGDMSLVGPRPPLLYELKAYDAWHRRRLLEAKPGLTGLWQLSGRSRSCFNDMVRLDLRYARMQSVWLDLSLLFRTVRVLFSDEGAR
jgi:lipopolysaccharide/colanic/teichoic acid biosynthesis glycosyltransferase